MLTHPHAFAGHPGRQALDPLARRRLSYFPHSVLPSLTQPPQNNMDIVCQVPPGLADNDHSRATLGLSVLNYS